MAKDNGERNVDTIQFLIDPSTPSNTVFAIKESLKTIRANIVLSLDQNGCKKLVITSSNPSEGKTTTAVNLAIALSMADKRVLLVDNDLRKQKVGKLLKLKHYRGFTDIIKGDVVFDDVVNTTKYPNLHILSAGSSVINPSEIVASEPVSDFFNSISDRYDFILCDTPPVNVVSDSLPLTKISDGVLFVVRELVTTQKELKKALSSLSLIDAKILGIIYLGSDSTQPYYHSKYGKYGM